MKFDGGEKRQEVDRGERDKRQVLRSKTPSSEKSKTQLLRSWTFFLKNTCFLLIFGKKLLRSRKQLLKNFWTDRFPDFFWFR